MNIGIVGASGFVGKNMISKLDNGFEISLRNSDWQSKVLQSNVLINLVGKAHDHKGQALESDYYHVNVDLLKDLFNQFINSNCELFIHISSIAAVQEIGSESIINESTPCSPVSWYGKSKLLGEQWLMDQELPKNKRLVILRPPMIHGPGDKGNLGLLYKFVSKGLPYPLASFDNKRSFISISNLIFLVKKIVQNESKVPSGIYNVADDTPISTNEIISIMQEVTGRKIIKVSIPKKLVFFLAKIGDKFSLPFNSIRLKKMTSSLIVSNSKLLTVLDLNNLPHKSLKELKRTIQTFQTNN